MGKEPEKEWIYICVCVCVCVCASESEVAQSCPILWDPRNCSLPGSSLHGILQARVLEWVAISFSRGSSWSRDRTWVSCILGRRFNLWATREARMCVCMCVNWLQSCPTLHDPMGYSLPGSSVHGIFQTRILEWVAMASSRGSSRLRDGTCVFFISCLVRQVVTMSATWEAFPTSRMQKMLSKSSLNPEAWIFMLQE